MPLHQNKVDTPDMKTKTSVAKNPVVWLLGAPGLMYLTQSWTGNSGLGTGSLLSPVLSVWLVANLYMIWFSHMHAWTPGLCECENSCVRNVRFVKEHCVQSGINRHKHVDAASFAWG